METHQNVADLPGGPATPSQDLNRALERAVSETAGENLTVVVNNHNQEGESEVNTIGSFPLNALPLSIREYVERVAEINRAPVSLAACCALGTLSAAIGKGLRVSSIPGQLTPANLYMLVGASSGSGKSLVFKSVTHPLRDYGNVGRALQDSDREARSQNIRALETAIHEARVRSESAELSVEEHNRILREIDQNERTLVQVRAEREVPTLLCEDTTPAALVKLLEANNECIASFSSDARDIANRLGGPRNKNRATVEGILLKAFSEDPHQVERATQDPIELREPNLSCLWLLQPDLVQKLFECTSLTDGGLLPRFLIHNADCKAVHIDRRRQFIPDAVEHGWNQLVCSLVDEYRMSRERRTVTANAAAVAAMDHDYNRLVDRRNLDLSDVQSYVARWNENAWRIALVLHAAEHGRNAHEVELSEATARRALSIMEWFAQEQLDILAANRDEAYRARVDRVRDLISRNRQVTARDVQRARIVATSGEAEALLVQMRADGVLRDESVTPPNGGKKKRIFLSA